MHNVMKRAGRVALGLSVIVMACACGRIYVEEHDAGKPEEAAETADSVNDDAQLSRSTGFAGESAADGTVDFAALGEINSEIFAWLYIPDTAIDCPVLQSGQSDTFYEDHNAYGKEDDAGAAYIELANLTSMCDFNTVLHGKTGTDEDGLFADLYRFADPQFFEDHEYVYLYLDGNVLTYEVFAAYERENTSLIRTYDFTYLSGCQKFMDDLYGTRDMQMNLREGWENINAYNYVITLTTQKAENAEHQFVVVAVLVEDAAGTINRVVTE